MLHNLNGNALRQNLVQIAGTLLPGMGSRSSGFGRFLFSGSPRFRFVKEKAELPKELLRSLLEGCANHLFLRKVQLPHKKVQLLVQLGILTLKRVIFRTGNEGFFCFSCGACCQNRIIGLIIARKLPKSQCFQRA